MASSHITSLLIIFGFVIVLGFALLAESIVNHLKRRGWNPDRTYHKLKFVFFSMMESLVVRWTRLFKRENK